MKQLLTALAAAILLVTPQRAAALAMQVSNISDFSPPTWSIGDPAVQTSMDICIYGLNVPNLTSYAITVSSSPSNYRIADSSSHYIPYTLYWDDGGSNNLGTNGGTQLSDGVKLTLRHNLDILTSNCVLGPDARLTLKITQADMTTALSGTYQGTITIMLTPN